VKFGFSISKSSVKWFHIIIKLLGCIPQLIRGGNLKFSKMDIVNLSFDDSESSPEIMDLHKACRLGDLQ
jgi:hypothetical protein